MYTIPLHAIVLADRNATVIEVVLPVTDDDTDEPFTLNGVGSSKREPGDHYDESVGIGIALARSLRSLAEEVESAARVRLAEIEEEHPNPLGATIPTKTVPTKVDDLVNWTGFGQLGPWASDYTHDVDGFHSHDVDGILADRRASFWSRVRGLFC